MLRLLRCKEISFEKFTECIDILNSLDVQTDIDTYWECSMQLARRHHLSYYDSMYLELAMEKAKSHSVVLATYDKALVRTAKAEGIPLLYQKD